jgi:hypothetical protein
MLISSRVFTLRTHRGLGPFSKNGFETAVLALLWFLWVGGAGSATVSTDQIFSVISLGCADDDSGIDYLARPQFLHPVFHLQSVASYDGVGLVGLDHHQRHPLCIHRFRMA